MTHPLLQNHPDLASAISLLDNWSEHHCRRQRLPGLALGIVHAGELLWGRGYGYANVKTRAPVTLDTRFRIASITKTFTATAILQLRDAGALRLDDPVAQHLDWFDLRYQDAPPITIRNLLTHTAGLPRDSTNPMWTELEAPSDAAFIADTQSRRLTRGPYEKFAYSNLGYALLGGIVAAVSGRSWADYLQARLLDPLGMDATQPQPRADDPLLATGYSKEQANGQRQPFPFWLMRGFEASANFASSVNDLVKYAAFHLGVSGGEALSPHSLTDMHRVHWLNEDWKGGYGLGMGLHRIKDWQISGHGGGYPGYLTAFTLCRAHNTGVIALCNALGSNPHAIAEQAYKLVLPELVKATAAEPSAAPAGWQRYLGIYESAWERAQVLLRGGKLKIVSLDAIDAPPITLTPTEEAHVFTLEQAGQSNETLRFELDAAGAVIRMWERNEYSERISD